MLSRRKMKKGQTMVEMALAVPALALLLVVATDFARVFYAANGTASAARAGVQYGAQTYTTAIDYNGIQQAALNDGKNLNGLTAEATDICMCNGSQVACSPPQCAEPQLFIRVKTRMTFKTLLTYPGIPSQFPLTSTAMMEVQ